MALFCLNVVFRYSQLIIIEHLSNENDYWDCSAHPNGMGSPTLGVCRHFCSIALQACACVCVCVGWTFVGWAVVRFGSDWGCELWFLSPRRTSRSRRPPTMQPCWCVCVCGCVCVCCAGHAGVATSASHLRLSFSNTRLYIGFDYYLLGVFMVLTSLHFDSLDATTIWHAKVSSVFVVVVVVAAEIRYSSVGRTSGRTIPSNRPGTGSSWEL